MGNKTSKSSSSEKRIDASNSQTLDNSNQNNLNLSFKSLNNSIDNTSTYGGLNANDNLNTKQQASDNSNSDLLTQEKTNSDNNPKQMYKIFWREECNEVLITGKFCEWKKTDKMKKIKNNLFEKEIPINDISKQKCEFKFIVDGSWKLSDSYPVIKEKNGFVNNYIDSNYIKTHANDNKVDANNKTDTNNNNISNKTPDNSLEKKKTNYGNIYPNEDQLNEEAPRIPDVLDIFIQLDDVTNQALLGNGEYLSYSLYNLCSSYKNIFQPAHSYLNHLLIKRNNIKRKKTRKKEKVIESNNNNNINMKYIRINCNAKVKSKCLSIIYFSPVEEENQLFD